MTESLAYKLPTYTDITGSDHFLNDTKPGGLLELSFNYIFPLAAIALFIFLLWGGISYMLSMGNPDKTKAAWAKITQALIGFIIIFTSWWLIQLVEVIFGVTILGN